MHENESPAEGATAPDDAGESRIIIAVVRSGGIAGLRRRWRVAPAPYAAPEWVTLVERCPWGEEFDTTPGADRYVWSIEARMPDDQRQQVVPDALLQGPWRELVDAVREADAAED